MTVSKYWDRSIRANSVDQDQTAPEEQSDQGLHCLPFFFLQNLDSLWYFEAHLLKF